MWLALGLVLIFVPWFPRTKHFHLLAGPFNFLTRPERASLGAMDRLALEDESIERFGAARIEHLSRTQIVDAYACIMCNRCQDVCPAYQAGTPLSPAALEVNKRYVLWEDAPALARGADSPSTLFETALPARACGPARPAPPAWKSARRQRAAGRHPRPAPGSGFDARPPADTLAVAFTQAERTGDPWGNPRGARLAWAHGLDVPRMADKGRADVLYWVGCAGAFDPAGQRVSRAMVRILRAAGVDFAVLGDEERCTCEWARRGGQEALYQEATAQIVETFNQYQFS